MRLPVIFTGLLTLLAGLALAGCWSRETPVARGNQTQVLHRGLGADVAELDPHIVTGLPELNVVSALFEGLVAEDPRDLHPVPGVASSWDISHDQLRYTFQLRPEARWSNGDQLTAHDFVNSFRRVLTASLGADYASMLYVVQNAEAYHKGEIIGRRSCDRPPYPRHHSRPLHASFSRSPHAPNLVSRSPTHPRKIRHRRTTRHPLDTSRKHRQ